MADNSTPAPKRQRGPGRPFQKGQPSANPSGRPKLIVEFQAALREQHYPKALLALLECLDNDDGRVRIAAVREVLDRLFGKSTQKLSGEDGKPLAVSVDLVALLDRLGGK